MIVTSIIVTLFVTLQPVSYFFARNSWLLWLFLGATFVIMIMLACCESIARSYPLNLILLMGFTLCESALIGVISSTYQTSTILIAVAITSVVVIGITAFAFQTKIDFTGAGIYLFVISLVIMVFGIVCIIIRSQIMQIVYAALGAGLFSMYLVFDTQLMLGGNLLHFR